MEFILAGQPNCGKSTIFNEVAGYKSVASNFPGITVKYTKSHIELENQKISVIDIPGTYSLQTSDEAELAATKYILNAPEDAVIINILDASVLSRSLELTLQLMELQKPMVVALNMIDEADRKGIKINSEKLSKIIGVPVIKTNGRKGKGIFQLFNQAYLAGNKQIKPSIIKGPITTENFSKSVLKMMKKKGIPERWNYRFMTLKLLEKDDSIIIFLDDYFKKKDWEFINKSVKEIEKIPQRNSEFIISSIRHNMAFQIFENVAKVERSIKKDVRDMLDNLFMHPFLGYVFLISILYLTFWLIFTIGGIFEPLFLNNFEKLSNLLSIKFADTPFFLSFLRGFVQGIGGGIGIVIPFLLPFFIMLSLLEDTGYLARVAYLIDNLMHKIGLHGMSVVPIILGYGCTVPGILATRILKSPRDKFITATLTTMVPCSARMTIIFGLVGFFISIKAAILIYIINIIILGFTGKLMSKAMPQVSPGLILEIPKYHLPGVKALLNKTWFRLKEFVYIAWPLLIIGSIILELIEYFNLTNSINSFLSPFTSGILGLPAVVGVTLIFGIMRKELALILLFSALKTKEILTVMTPAQIYSFTIFATFYIPCIATIAALARELNWKKAGLITGLTFLIAIILAVLVRFIFPIFT